MFLTKFDYKITFPFFKKRTDEMGFLKYYYILKCYSIIIILNYELIYSNIKVEYKHKYKRD